MRSTWIPSGVDEGACLQLAQALGIHPVVARVLVSRGISDASEARTFLAPTLDLLPDPSALPGMALAVERLVAAVQARERIAIFGDYDVDGVTGAGLLAEFLTTAGVTPIVGLPCRQGRGYGLGPETVDEFAAQGITLIVTVDNGTRAHEALARAKERGIAVIVTDHHDAAGELPEALAIVNPRLLPPDSPFAPLSGCGVAFMLIVALRRKMRESGLLPSPEPNLRRSLDLVALGTVADVMPLTGINRVLVRAGLEELIAARRPGMQALFESSSTTPADCSPVTIAFRLAPRLNAAGRMGDPAEALRLLTTTDGEEARRIAAKLEAANRERQRLEETILREAGQQLSDSERGATPAGLVVHDEAWHPGVIGIVAARLAEAHGRPAVVIAGGTTPARGSARSGGTVDLVEALSRCSDLLVRFGGHPMAAGLSIEPTRITVFAERFAAACLELGAASGEETLAIDAVVAPEEIDSRLVEGLAMLAPFGAGNPEPVLSIASLRILDRRIVGEGHLRLRLGAGSRTFSAIGFDMACELPPETTDIAAAFTPQFNTWNGITSLQLKLRAIVPASPPKS